MYFSNLRVYISLYMYFFQSHAQTSLSCIVQCVTDRQLVVCPRDNPRCWRRSLEREGGMMLHCRVFAVPRGVVLYMTAVADRSG